VQTLFSSAYSDAPVTGIYDIGIAILGFNVRFEINSDIVKKNVSRALRRVFTPTPPPKKDPDRPAKRPRSDFSDISDTFARLIEFVAPPCSQR